MTRFRSFRGAPATDVMKPTLYCRDNFRYYRHNYRIEYAKKGVSGGNLYATGKYAAG